MLIELNKSYRTIDNEQVDIVAKLLTTTSNYIYVGVVRRENDDVVHFFNNMGRAELSSHARKQNLDLTIEWYEPFSKMIHAVVFDDNSFSTYQTKEFAQEQAKNSSFSDARYALLKIEEIFDAT